MFIAHTKGHPVTIKTQSGDYFFAFESLDDGQVFLRWKQSPCSLNTLDEILRLNPTAFPQKFRVLTFSTREAIEMFTADPLGFPVEKHLVTLKHDLTA